MCLNCPGVVLRRPVGLDFCLDMSSRLEFGRLCVLMGPIPQVLVRKTTPSGDMEQASREVKGHMKSVRHRNFRQNIFVVITIAIVVDIIVVISTTYD